MSILSLKNITKQYARGEGKAIDNVSLHVEAGEILALLGQSGSGKTTLLRMIAGFERPTAGEIILNGEMVTGGNLFVEPEKRGVGIVFQDYALFPHLNVKENMEFGLSKLSPPERTRRMEVMLELTGTASLVKRFPHELSGGQKQRIALARAMAPEPSVILFDEPFSSIDSVLKSQMRKDIRNILKKAGTTAVFVTHDTRDAMAMADRICMLHKGKSIQTGTPGELYNKPENAYVANFFGKTNLIRAKVTEKGLKTPFGIFPYKGNKRVSGEKVMLSIRPENFVVKDGGKDCICGEIVDQSFMGDYNELVCEVDTGEGTREELVVRISPEKSCGDNRCWFKPRKGRIHILGDNPEDI